MTDEFEENFKNSLDLHKEKILLIQLAHILESVQAFNSDELIGKSKIKYPLELSFVTSKNGRITININEEHTRIMQQCDNIENEINKLLRRSDGSTPQNKC